MDGFRGVGKTVLLREFNNAAREQGWSTSGVVQCDENEDLRRVVAKLAHPALREISKRRLAGDRLKRSLGVLRAFTFTFEDDARWHSNVDAAAVKGVADSGDPELDIVELVVELGAAAAGSARASVSGWSAPGPGRVAERSGRGGRKWVLRRARGSRCCAAADRTQRRRHRALGLPARTG